MIVNQKLFNSVPETDPISSLSILASESFPHPRRVTRTQDFMSIISVIIATDGGFIRNRQPEGASFSFLKPCEKAESLWWAGRNFSQLWLSRNQNFLKEDR